jgi:hypothetical protein
MCGLLILRTTLELASGAKRVARPKASGQAFKILKPTGPENLKRPYQDRMDCCLSVLVKMTQSLVFSDLLTNHKHHNLICDAILHRSIFPSFSTA